VLPTVNRGTRAPVKLAARATRLVKCILHAVQPAPPMKLPSTVFALLLLVAPALSAASAADATLARGLETFVASGIEAGVRTWYPDRPELAAATQDELLKATRNLGTLIDTEIVAVQPISKRVTRYYVALYFTRRPLWIRLERYQNEDRSFYLPLKQSTNPDEILPGYLTEFRAQTAP
jgi:hypothetical protein